MKIKPILDKICVKAIQEETQTSGGIFIPDNAKDAPLRGTVVSVGTGRRNKNGDIEPLHVSEGDVIMFVKGAGESIKVDDEEYLILTEEQILAVLV
jgi:chaperonin GroES